MAGTLPEYSGLVRWTINDVQQWLSSNAFSEFCRSFRENGIDGVKFVDLDEIELNRMRTPMNKRSKLMTIIKSIKKPDLSGVQNLISNRAAASPHVPQRDYNQKAPPPPIDSDSGSGTDDDYEWADSDFEDDHDAGGHGHVNQHEERYLQLSNKAQKTVSYQSLIRQSRTTQEQDSDMSPDEDYENTKQKIHPPRVPGRDAPKNKFSVDSLKTALSDFKQNSMRQKEREFIEDGPEENYDEPAPPSLPSRTAPQVSSQPSLPSRPGRRGQPAPPPEIEQPTYEETDDPEPALPSRPARRAKPTPPVEQAPPPQPSRPGRRAQPAPPPQDEQDVYEDPDNPTAQPPPPGPRGGKRVVPTPSSQNTRRPPPPINEPEEHYEDPNLPQAPKPPTDEQPTYEELPVEEEKKNKTNHKQKGVSVLPTGKTKESKVHHIEAIVIIYQTTSNLCPCVTKWVNEIIEDYEKPNDPTTPTPTRFPSRQKGGRVPSPVDDQPGYMEMQNNEGPTEDDIYVVPEEEEEKKKPKKAPPPGNRGLPKTPADLPQSRIAARQQEPPPVSKPHKREPRKEPAADKPTSRGLPPHPKGSRPLPTVPPTNDQYEDEDDDDLEEDLNSYNWYRGNMTRQEGDAKLKQSAQNGMFAIRDSSKKKEDGDPRPYTLMIFNDNKVYNLPIRKRLKDGHYAMGNPKPKEETFPKLADLVAFFSKRMIVLAGSGQTHLKMPIP
ncbi:B-cell linker protein-like [Argopecten irradians]|uniref:B-cell linker protein-like n=1 Tax=Argopecten irradians TaxID=31199 RepID=UPI003718481B